MAHDVKAPYSTNPATTEELQKLKVSFAGDVVTWTCPRCEAEFSERIETDQPIHGFELDSVGGDKDHGLLDLVCECGTKHSGGEVANCGFAALKPMKKKA